MAFCYQLHFVYASEDGKTTGAVPPTSDNMLTHISASRPSSGPFFSASKPKLHCVSGKQKQMRAGIVPGWAVGVSVCLWQWVGVF